MAFFVVVADFVNDPFIPQRGRRTLVARKRSIDAAVGRPSAVLTTHQHNHQHRSHQLRHGRLIVSSSQQRQQQQSHRSSQQPWRAAASLAGDNDDDGSSSADRVADSAGVQVGNVPRLFPRNLSPATGPTTTTATVAQATAPAAIAKTASTNRDTFYLARGSRIHQQQQQQHQRHSQQ